MAAVIGSGSRAGMACRQLAQAAYAVLRSERPRPTLQLLQRDASRCTRHATSHCRAYPTHAHPRCMLLRHQRAYSAAAVKPMEPQHEDLPPFSQTSRRQAPRNAVGVQLMSPTLHSQLFPPGSCSHLAKVDPMALSISQEHLSSHGLQPSQASVLPEVAFELPPLLQESPENRQLHSKGKQPEGPPRPSGPNLAEHFWIMGREAAQPWLGMAHLLSKHQMPPRPEGVHDPAQSSNAQGERDMPGFHAREWLALEPSVRDVQDLLPPNWVRRSGWTRYPLLSCAEGKAHALGPGEPVPYPPAEDGPMTFDVETMPRCSHFAVMATAVSSKAWYSWLSPWLLGETEDMKQLIPFGAGPGTTARLLVGHNVGYDRARVLDEYSLERSSIRWLDTMSLHVATRGISSPQRPAWMQHANERKWRQAEKKLERLEIESAAKREIMRLIGGEALVDDEALESMDVAQLIEDFGGEHREEMREAVKDAMSSLNSRAARDVADVNTAAASASGDSDEDASASSLWQDITSKNSLADVAELHCGITLSKDSRNLFVESDTREQILEHLSELLDYCASDVDVTHKVFQKVWPVFVEENCRHPVTMAGVFDLGSAFLPVDEEWNDYIARSEHCFRTASNSVHESLVKLAEAAREKGCEGLTWGQAQEIANRRQALEEQAALHIESGGQEPLPYVRPDVKDVAEDAAAGPRAWWERDPWLSQLDWSPKKPKKIKLSAGADEDGNELDVPLVADPGHIIVPTWYRDLVVKAPPTGISLRSPVALALAQLSFDGEELLRDEEGRWSTRESGPLPQLEKVLNPLTSTFLKTKVGKAVSSLQEPHGVAAVEALRAKDQEQAKAAIKELAEAALAQSDDIPAHLQELDWTAVQVKDPNVDVDSADFDQPWWPKWYWDIFKPNTGELELTIRSKIAPTLLNVSWRGCPLFHSREHGWLYRIEPEVNQQSDFTTRQKPVEFTHKADAALKLLAGPQHHVVSSRGRETKDLIPDPTRPTFLKVPHSSGDEANVGSPFAKNFISFFDDGTLRSEHPSEEGRQASKAALDLNAQCSYWISARDRVERQMVVWDGDNGVDIGSHSTPGSAKLGMILPQVIQMGTVTRRAIEKTWLTASNAKKNRVGSELKSMVKAPPGWSIVGADVDSEELWICSVMGDAQFGVHGATAVGWMTLEGTKAQGTDLHSKTASILGTSRNQAKVFNYSRIYGAGIRHATQLMLKANPSMPSEEAMRRAKQLYAATKGQNTHSNDFFGSKFWYGGSESYVFNKLESIAISDQPRTPALDCGVTAALSRKYLPKRRWMDGKVGEDYMPSRINWVVQSSGVDYLHMLTAAMTHLCKTYDIKARFMLSVHDEVRYLCREEDRYRTALALQIANLWTRAMFAYRLDFDDLPQGCAFFSQVDIDRVLRKEVDDPCVTPSHPVPVLPGEALTIDELLAKTHNGSLAQAAGSPRSAQCPAFAEHPLMSPAVPAFEWHPQTHRSSGQKGLLYLQAQATSELDEIRSLDRRAKQLDQAAKMPLSKTARRPFVPRAPSPSAAAVRAYSVSSTAQSSKSILDAFPTTPNRPRQPFFRMARHRSEMLRLYRALMRATAQWPHLRESLRITAKANKRQTSPGRVNSQLLAAEKLLDLLHSANAGSVEAKTKIHARETRLAENKRRKRLDDALKILDPPAPVPRISGALLRPSLFNPPLPRFKPVQPEAITMMIAKRRMRRAARRRYRADNAELLASLSQELRIQSALGRTSSPWADPAGWFGPLEEAQAAISATFDADVRRSQMVFPESMLRQAKQARRSKLRARLRRAYRRAQQQSLDIDL